MPIQYTNDPHTVVTLVFSPAVLQNKQNELAGFNFQEVGEEASQGVSPGPPPPPPPPQNILLVDIPCMMHI